MTFVFLIKFLNKNSQLDIFIQLEFQQQKVLKLVAAKTYFWTTELLQEKKTK